MVRNTPKVVNLIIALWTLEVDQDSRDTNGRLQSQLSRQLAEMFPSPTDCLPTAARLLHLYIFSREWVLSESISGVRLKEIATTGLAHIKKSLSALSRPMNLSILENLYLNLSTLRRLLSTPLIPLLIIQRSTLVVTEALVSVTSQPLEAASADAITKCIAEICGYLYKYLARDGLPGLAHSLEFGLLVGLFKAYPWLEWRGELEDRKTAVEACEILLVVHMPKYFIYISVLRQVHKFLVRQSKMINPSFHGYREIWPVFHKLAMARLQLATASELETEQCNSPECQKPSSMRCSSCLAAAYCSQKCQVAAWNSHRETCHARATALQNGTTPELTTDSEDVRFALRVVRHDLEHNNFKADICAKWSESSTLPLYAGIDYSVFPPTLNIDAPSIVKDRMTSYAAIYVVFPQGKEGKEYHVCDLGPTRGPTDSDEETIKVVTQIISTQHFFL
ncbi:hypothetical protein GGX14DRAFT_474477 [Mycena pura]|uniref:MYND-type domain-containing protein n=1 Tax=Mycena pura TaxID=153505 RepID=A0AAD6UVF6_9AGAR|nr:hypothetical protein GGX14DRAFT_474477 [Mycena pura]